jgi:hypothetical protein
MHGIHGNIDVATMSEWRFAWNGFTTVGSEAFAIDLTYLERAIGEDISGLVGLDLFEGYYVVINYAQQSLQLWSSMPDIFKRTAYVEFGIDMLGHVPVITLQHEAHSLRFAFDSGSGSNILDHAALNLISTDVKYLNQVDIIGADQRVVRTSRIEATGLKTNGINLPPTNFVVTDLSAMKRATSSPIDGIIGQPFFGDRIILIDRDRKYLRLSQVMSDLSASGVQPASAEKLLASR